jgi:hypothetical protein
MVYGARLIAQSLKDLGVKVIFGLPGLPVIDIARKHGSSSYLLQILLAVCVLGERHADVADDRGGHEHWDSLYFVPQ